MMLLFFLPEVYPETTDWKNKERIQNGHHIPCETRAPDDGEFPQSEQRNIRLQRFFHKLKKPFTNDYGQTLKHLVAIGCAFYIFDSVGTYMVRKVDITFASV